jgi:hypothetical protein
MSDSETVIKTDRCDHCKKRAVGVEFHLRGTPVLFECRSCAPRAFDFASARLVGQVLADLIAA